MNITNNRPWRNKIFPESLGKIRNEKGALEAWLLLFSHLPLSVCYCFSHPSSNSSRKKGEKERRKIYLILPTALNPWQQNSVFMRFFFWVTERIGEGPRFPPYIRLFHVIPDSEEAKTGFSVSYSKGRDFQSPIQRAVLEFKEKKIRQQSARSFRCISIGLVGKSSLPCCHSWVHRMRATLRWASGMNDWSPDPLSNGCSQYAASHPGPHYDNLNW